ncbi:MEDS domain-containing protein [Mycolicibacterium sp.]|uniref:MEDS domain-containing protein n=1 Tax=Mycolicibacterium sp. TaxID=2320850 RepID=UPI0028AC33ED|nr:MEDS domain-containing protein [Mycolicibacterium sp.]
MTHRHGVVDTATGLVPFGHLGWAYRDRADFLRHAAGYLADGLAHNQRLRYVGAGTREQLRGELDMMPGDTSTVTVTPAEEFYGVAALSDVVDPDTALDLCASDVEDALAAGYSGVRIVGDPTELNARPEQRDSFARLEFLIDQRMADAPITALCAYDTSRLAEGAGEMVCLHPLMGPDSPTFHLYAESAADFALGGEIDSASAETFSTVLQRIWPVVGGDVGPGPGGDDVVIDIDAVEFIGHRQLLTLDRYARRDARQIVMRGSSPVVTRLVKLLDLTSVRLEPTA